MEGRRVTAPKGSHSVIVFGHDTSLAEGGEDELLPRDRGSKERPGAKKTPPRKERRKRVGYWKASGYYTTPDGHSCKGVAFVVFPRPLAKAVE